jgi:hypothetical protein
MNGEFDVMAPTSVLSNPAHSGNSLIPDPIDQQPALAMALVKQVFDPTIEQLPKLGRASCLLEVPEQGPGAPIERPQLEGAKGRAVAPLGPIGAGPAPELVGA